MGAKLNLLQLKERHLHNPGPNRTVFTSAESNHGHLGAASSPEKGSVYVCLCVSERVVDGSVNNVCYSVGYYCEARLTPHTVVLPLSGTLCYSRL